MRPRSKCPACGSRFGRVETVVKDGQSLTVYWHTELTDAWEFCVEYPSGDLEKHQDRIEAKCAQSVGD